jgi:plasmid stability protein
MMQIRNVPDALHRRLKARAALEGKSLSDYLLAEIREAAARPTVGGAARPLGEALSGRSINGACSCSARHARSGVIIVDASAVVEVRLRTPVAPAVERRLFAAGETLHAPHLIDFEIAHVVRRYAAAGDMREG